MLKRTIRDVRASKPLSVDRFARVASPEEPSQLNAVEVRRLVLRMAQARLGGDEMERMFADQKQKGREEAAARLRELAVEAALTVFPYGRVLGVVRRGGRLVIVKTADRARHLLGRSLDDVVAVNVSLGSAEREAAAMLLIEGLNARQARAVARTFEDGACAAAGSPALLEAVKKQLIERAGLSRAQAEAAVALGLAARPPAKEVVAVMKRPA
jgi:hypothetical protein